MFDSDCVFLSQSISSSNAPVTPSHLTNGSMEFLFYCSIFILVSIYLHRNVFHRSFTVVFINLNASNMAIYQPGTPLRQLLLDEGNLVLTLTDIAYLIPYNLFRVILHVSWDWRYCYLVREYYFISHLRFRHSWNGLFPMGRIL